MNIGDFLSENSDVILQAIDGCLGIRSIHLRGVLSLMQQQIEDVDLFLGGQQFLLHVSLHLAIVLLSLRQQHLQLSLLLQNLFDELVSLGGGDVGDVRGGSNKRSGNLQGNQLRGALLHFDMLIGL